MFPPIEYLGYAERWFGKVRYDLASSGVARVGASALAPVPTDDPAARDRFRARLAARYRVPEAEVYPCLGGSGALFVAFAALLDRGDTVLVESPGYEPLWRVPEALGMRVSWFERGPALEPERVMAALPEGARMVVVTNPHNPGAGLTPEPVLAELAARLAARGAWLFVDEAYLELMAPGRTARSLAPNVITCSSTTKCWGVNFARAGWLLLPEERVSAARTVELHLAGHAPAASWALGAAVLDAADELAARAVELQKDKRSLIDTFMRMHANSIAWDPPPRESLFGFVRDRRGRRLLPLLERAAAERGVIVSPGEFFREPTAFRLSWTAPAEVLEPGLGELAAALEL